MFRSLESLLILFLLDVEKMGRLKRIVTPWKINMELKYGGLEDDVPFQLSDF